MLPEHNIRLCIMPVLNPKSWCFIFYGSGTGKKRYFLIQALCGRVSGQMFKKKRRSRDGAAGSDCFYCRVRLWNEETCLQRQKFCLRYRFAGTK
jgi:hypothetical protein